MYIYEYTLYTHVFYPTPNGLPDVLFTNCVLLSISSRHLPLAIAEPQEVLGDLNLAANCVAKYILEDGSLLTGHHDDLNITEIFDLKDSS